MPKTTTILMLRKVLDYAMIMTIFSLLVVLPQINIATYVQPGFTGKFIVFACGCLVILGCTCAMLVFGKIEKVQISKLDLALFLLFGFVLINRYLIQSTYGFSLRFLELLGLALLYVVLRNLTIKAYIYFLWAIVISGIVQASYGVLQLLDYYPSNHSGFGLTGGFFNPGPYAGFLVVVCATCLGVYLFREHILKRANKQNKAYSRVKSELIASVFKYFLPISIAGMSLLIFATRSRAACLAILVSSLVLMELRYHFIETKFRKTSQTKKIAILTFSLSIFFTGLFGAYHLKKESADGRLFIWKVASGIIKDYPIAGVGFDRFKAHYMNYQADYFNKHGETVEAMVADDSYYAFNDWLQYIVENGCIGILLLGILLYTLFKIKVAANNSHLNVMARAVIVSMAVFALFSYPVQILPIKIIGVVLMGFIANLDKNRRTILAFGKNTNRVSLYGIRAAFVVIGFVTLSVSLTYVKSLDFGLRAWKKALTTYQYGDYERAIEIFSNAHPVLNKNGDFLMNYGKALSIAEQNNDAIKILEEVKKYLNTTTVEIALGDSYKAVDQFEKSEIAYQHAINMIPARFYPLYLKAKLYEESGNKEKAMDIAEIILKKEIKIPSTAIKEIKAEMKNILSQKYQLPKHD